jgi:hypothetical protein
LPFATATSSTDLATPAFANIPEGVGVYVLSRGRIYWSVPVGTGDLAGTGNDWKSDATTSKPDFQLQATWFIDGTIGDDDGTGIDAAHPLASGDELMARLQGGKFVLSVAMVITISGTTAIPRLILQPFAATTAASMRISGVPTATLLATTIAVYTPAAANTPVKLTATGVIDWATAGPGGTSLVCDAATRNCRFTMTNGPAVGAHFWGAKAAPDAGDPASVLRVHDMAPSPIGLVGIATVAPANGDAFVVESLPSVQVLDIDFRGQSNGDVFNTVYTPSLRVENLALKYCTVSGYDSLFAPSTMVMFGCSIQNLFAPTGFNQAFGGLTVAGCWVNATSIGNCLIGWGLLTTVGKSVTGTLVRLTIGPGSNVQTGHNTVQGTSLNVLGALYISAGTEFICDATGPGITCVGTVLIASGLRGYGNTTYGMVVKNGARFQYGSTLPTLTGTLGDAQIANNGGTALVLPWSAMPWNDGVYFGTAQLGAGGTVTVAVPYLAAGQKITLGRNTPAGAIGDLSAPAATRTTAQFVLNSSNAGDTSTVDWQTSAYGTGINISRWL